MMWNGCMKAKRNRLEIRNTQFRVYNLFENQSKLSSKMYQRTVVLMILSSLGLGIVNTVEGYHHGWVVTARMVLETILLVVFFAEYILRVWSSGAHGTYGVAGGWRKYLITPHMVIDALVILSSLCLVLSSHLSLESDQRRLLYLLQLLRILRIDRQRGAFHAFWRVFKKHRKELLTCWYMGFLMVTFVSFLVYALEKTSDGQARTVDNLFDGVYWGVISLTTIGYGEIHPETTSSKILICCFAVFGTCFIAMPAGIIGSGFALQVAEQQKEKHVNRRRRPAAVLIQSFWRKFAADRNYSATWLPHIKGREEKYNKQMSLKADVLGVPYILTKYNGTERMTAKETTSDENNALWFPRKTLTVPEKIALRFVRLLKCISSTKKFRQARRPYDERDILDQFASSQIEMFAKLRNLRQSVESCTECTDMKTAENLQKVTAIHQKVTDLSSQVRENNLLLKLLIHQHDIELPEISNDVV